MLYTLQDTRYKNLYFTSDTYITDNISYYSYFPTKHIIKLIINKYKQAVKEMHFSKTLAQRFLLIKYYRLKKKNSVIDIIKAHNITEL